MTESTPAIVPASDEEIANLKERAEKKDASGRATGLHNYHVMAAPYIARIDFEKAEREKAQAEVARLQLKVSRYRVAVRNCGKVIADRRLLLRSSRYADLLKLMEAFTWKIAQLTGDAKPFTFTRHEEREDYFNHRDLRADRDAILKERDLLKSQLAEAQARVKELEDLLISACNARWHADVRDMLAPEARAILASRAEGEKR